MVRCRVPEARLILNRENRGFGQANNQGVAASREAYALLLNSDAALSPGALPELVAEMERDPEAGAVRGGCTIRTGAFRLPTIRFQVFGVMAWGFWG